MFYSRAHYRRVSPRADTLQEVADRIARNRLWAQVGADVAREFPVITPENAQAMMQYQRRRAIELGAITN